MPEVSGTGAAPQTESDTCHIGGERGWLWGEGWIGARNIDMSPTNRNQVKWPLASLCVHGLVRTCSSRSECSGPSAETLECVFGGWCHVGTVVKA